MRKILQFFLNFFFCICNAILYIFFLFIHVFFLYLRTTLNNFVIDIMLAVIFYFYNLQNYYIFRYCCTQKKIWYSLSNVRNSFQNWKLNLLTVIKQMINLRKISTMSVSKEYHWSGFFFLSQLIHFYLLKKKKFFSVSTILFDKYYISISIIYIFWYYSGCKVYVCLYKIYIHIPKTTKVPLAVFIKTCGKQPSERDP